MPVDLPNLTKLPREAQVALTRLKSHANDLETSLNTVLGAVRGLPPGLTLAQIQSALSATGSNPLNVTGLIGSPAPTPTPSPTAPPSPPNPSNPVVPPAGGTCAVSLAAGQPGGVPVAPNLRWFRGNFCGIHVPGLPFVPGGCSDFTLAYTPFIDRYGPSDRASIYAAYVARGYTHFKMSWVDARNFGTSVASFVSIAQEVVAAGLYPVIFILAKGDDPAVANMAPLIDPAINALLSAGAMPICCVGWELSLWMSPQQTQDAIDHIAALVVPTSNLYVHFQVGYASFQVSGTTSEFWIPNVGKLTGLLYQGDPNSDCPTLQARIADVLTRFAGNDGFPLDSGFGHPFDCVADELTAYNQFFAPNISEQAGNIVGFNAICQPAITGPAGTVVVQGFNNGAKDLSGGTI